MDDLVVGRGHALRSTCGGALLTPSPAGVFAATTFLDPSAAAFERAIGVEHIAVSVGPWEDIQ